MTFMFKHPPRLLPLLVCLAAGGVQAAPISAPTLQPWGTGKAQALSYLPTGNDRLAVSKRDGLRLLDAQGKTLSQIAGSFAGLDSRPLGDNVLVASQDKGKQQVALFSLDPKTREWQTPTYLPKRDYAVNGVCLYRDQASNVYLFTVGEEGKGEQWLVAADSKQLAAPLLVRSLPMPPQAKFCQVEDAAQQLFVNEENVGWWAYPAHAESDVERLPVAIVEPFGNVKKAAGAMAVVPGGVLGLDPEAAQLNLYQQQGKHWSPVASLALDGVTEPEHLALRETAKGLDVLVQDGATNRLFEGALNWKATPVALPPVLPVVKPLVQTDVVMSQGDAADDPAIWVNPKNPAQSRVLGTNKQQGLEVYDLQGKRVQHLPVGRLNNVDVRPGFTLGARTVDLAVATNRDHNSLSVFSIDRASGELKAVGEIATPVKDIYGLCLFKAPSGEIYSFANDKDGTFVQHRLFAKGDQVQGELVRQFKVATQPEGCVADDQRQRLFLGEEDVAVWAVDARPDQPATLTSVIKVGEQVHDDIEGLALYQTEKDNYLVISSQGNDSYVVVDAEPPFALHGAFRVGVNAEAGIDGTSETDGLDVTSANLGGPWSKGMLVVQDGRKRMPEQAQNFKYIPWSEVAKALRLP
ncbi:phytase [Pseudomonas helleri]|jgi:3-phytase|uniref:Phytase n=1 Tax=Pseudomonas helleri TaxID=1608996 RepID=A0A6A7ZD79_9PSED|nr:phytase [Pseudomonas helleri]KMN22604.1 3-phytase [Pseudomonas helleri]MQT36762.1 phytase [Pseudomonas helleri]MQU21746.1 phytase [Pseudomonas helleri]MQU42592.1 phytase [Pseudomonas helleri]MQU58319.1 phytase [Pseudomonas helleri]